MLIEKNLNNYIDILLHHTLIYFLFEFIFQIIVYF